MYDVLLINVCYFISQYSSTVFSAVHDFYEVQSARGVYITSVKEDGEMVVLYDLSLSLCGQIDGHVTSRISFNRGATWTTLTATLCVSHYHLYHNHFVSSRREGLVVKVTFTYT